MHYTLHFSYADRHRLFAENGEGAQLRLNLRVCGTSCCCIHSKSPSWLGASSMCGRPEAVLKNDKALSNFFLSPRTYVIHLMRGQFYVTFLLMKQTALVKYGTASNMQGYIR
jgi:hypothetical protein